MNVVIYARYSSHSQTEQSIEGQLKECMEYAKMNNLMVVGEYIDRAISGRSDDRPQFQQMIADSEKKIFQGVLVYQLDRFSRNRYDSAIYKNKLKKNNVRVFSAKENISQDASGILMESVLEGMAEYYSTELAQKVKRGLKINAEKALSNGGIIPLGFKTDKEKRYIIDNETAPIVKRIFEMFIENNTYTEIIRLLNSLGLKTVKGNKFNKSSIYRILINEKYIGTYCYGDIKIQNAIPQIIDIETFNKAQQLLKHKNCKNVKRKNADYLLTTKLFCGKCKEMFVGISGTSKTKRTYNYYSCNGKKEGKCDKKNIPKEFIEDIVIKQALKILTDKNIERIADEIIKLAEKEKSKSNIKVIEKQIKENNMQKKNLIDSLKICEYDNVRKTIFDEIKILENANEELEEKIKREKLNYLDIKKEEIEFFLYTIRNGDIKDIKYKKAVINTLVNKVYIYEDKLIIIFNVKDKNKQSYKKEISNIEEIESSFNVANASPNGIVLCYFYCKKIVIKYV